MQLKIPTGLQKEILLSVQNYSAFTPNDLCYSPESSLINMPNDIPYGRTVQACFFQKHTAVSAISWAIAILQFALPASGVKVFIILDTSAPQLTETSNVVQFESNTLLQPISAYRKCSQQNCITTRIQDYKKLTIESVIGDEKGCN